MSPAMNHLRRVLHFFRPEGPRLVFVVALMLLSTALNLLKPWPLAFLVDSVLGAKTPPPWIPEWLGSGPPSTRVAWLAGITLALHGLQSLVAAWQSHLLIGAGLSGLSRVRNALFQHLQSLAPAFHRRMPAGDLIYRASWDTYAFQSLFQQGLFGFLSAALSLSLMIAVMARLSPALTLTALATVPALLLVMKAFGARMGRHSLAAHAADSGVTSAVEQNIRSMPLVQSCGQEDNERARFAGRVREAFQARRSQHGWEVAYLGAIGVVFGIATALVLWQGARAVSTGALTLGALLVFLAYLTQFYDPLNQLSRVGTVLSDAGAGTRRVLEILDSSERVPEPTARSSPAPTLPEPGSALCLGFNRVGFAYEPGRPVLRDVSFTLNAGERVVLAGPSGAGKTTLLQLIPRFQEPGSGSVQLGSLELVDWPLRELRSRIAYVFQEPIILQATVAENLRYGRPDATLAEVEAAAKAVGAHPFIQRLPNGYETQIGDAALRLSMGERQRLSLARAFLQRSGVLLMDEPTSALDAASEAMVSAGATELMRGRTTLIVAHRSGSLPRPDRVIWMVDGTVTRLGTPEQVASDEPAFALAFATWLD
jgi:ABC-type multidrug transport system fused ATPase/permease subunit